MTRANIPTARLDSLVLLQDYFGKDKSWLLAHSELDIDKAAILEESLRQRLSHKPLAYIRKKADFFGRTFFVDERVLVPRPETEAMIELLKSFRIPTGCRIVDVGTGSGALAITAALERPGYEMNAIDINPACLTVARQNAKTFSVNLSITQSDLLTDIQDLHDYVLLANLPYIPTDYALNKAATHEPKQAIFGGTDGLDIYRRLFKQLSSMRPCLAVFTEALPDQHKELERIAEQCGYRLIDTKDYIQAFTNA